MKWPARRWGCTIRPIHGKSRHVGSGGHQYDVYRRPRTLACRVLPFAGLGNHRVTQIHTLLTSGRTPTGLANIEDFTALVTLFDQCAQRSRQFGAGLSHPYVDTIIFESRPNHRERRNRLSTGRCCRYDGTGRPIASPWKTPILAELLGGHRGASTRFRRRERLSFRPILTTWTRCVRVFAARR